MSPVLTNKALNEIEAVYQASDYLKRAFIIEEEFLGEWEVIWSGQDWNNARNKFEDFVLNRNGHYRLTAPEYYPRVRRS